MLWARGALSSSILPMTLAERDNHLRFFMEAQSEVKRGEVALPPGHTSRPKVKLGLKPQTTSWGWGGKGWKGTL